MLLGRRLVGVGRRSKVALAKMFLLCKCHYMEHTCLRCIPVSAQTARSADVHLQNAYSLPMPRAFAHASRIWRCSPTAVDIFIRILTLVLKLGVARCPCFGLVWSNLTMPFLENILLGESPLTLCRQSHCSDEHLVAQKRVCRAAQQSHGSEIDGRAAGSTVPPLRARPQARCAAGGMVAARQPTS